MSEFNCDVFVIPNHAKSSKSYSPEHWEDFINGINKYWNEFGVDLGITENSTLIQLWWTSLDCENWNDHNHKVFGYVPYYLPLEMVQNLKDGDSLVINTNKGDITLTANQGKYRYRNHGTFDAVVRQVTR